MYKNDVSLEKGSSSLKYNRARFGNVTRSRRLGGSASESSTSVVDDSCLRSVIGVYPPDFERVRSEAYGALDVLRSLGVDVDTCTSDISSSATVSSSVHVYDEKSVPEYLGIAREATSKIDGFDMSTFEEDMRNVERILSQSRWKRKLNYKVRKLKERRKRLREQ